MTSIPPVVTEAEDLVRTLSAQLTSPREGECLCCYVARLLDQFGCNGTHRHSLRYRDVMAPRATALEKQLRRVGACCCDCELFMNGYELRRPLRIADAMDDVWDVGGPDDDPEEDDRSADAGWADEIVADVPLPDCFGVRRGSTQPCGNWEPIRGG